MLKLKDNCQFNGVGYPTTLPGIEFLKPSEFQTFGSSKSAMDDVIGALKNDEIHIVGLYGMGGAGKTTLAKEVGNRVKEIFNEVVMVTISQTPNFKNIQGQLAGIPFGDDNKNCKILLTTRRQQVCIDMECQSRILLDILNDDEAVALLKRHAGIGDASNLNPLAVKIAKECDGLPLALVAIGSALREKDSDEWKVLHDKLRDSKLEDMISVTGEDSIVAGEKGIYATLKLSYDYLKGEQIQFCFLLCSLFPEDCEISLDKLVRIGIGLDLYQDVNSIEELRKQFRVMVNNLKASGLLIDAGEEVVKMHDMVRDVAIWISSGKHVFMNKSSMGLTERRKKNMLEQCTAISLMDNGSDINLLPQSLVCPRLEILLLNFGIDGDPGDFFKDMKALQVVTLIDVEMSFKSLELLTNLQSLRLKYCRLLDISFLGKLTTLKVLDLEGSSLAGEWPKELGDQLSELRVLDVRHSKLRIPRDRLRRFSQLEELYANPSFLWHSDEITSVEESCATVCELNSLSCLVSLSLRIDQKCLPNGFAFPKLERYGIDVTGSDFALFSGEYERSLSIESIEAVSLIAFEELLQNVQSLRLSDIKGLQNYFPSVDQTCFSELIYLGFGKCEELKCIIDSSQRQAPAAAFSNLKTLILFNMSHLEEIYKGAEPPSTFLEKLETVTISECHSLSQTEGENTAVLSSLESLQLRNLPELRFIWKGPVRLVSFKNLAHVQVHGCSNLKNLFALSIVRRLVQLVQLIISDCERLEHIVSDYNQGDEIAEIENGKNIVLPKLTKLRVLKLPKLISFCSENYYPTCPMLQLLEVDGCPNWTTPIIVEANMQNPPEFQHLQDCNDDVIPGTLVHSFQNLEDLILIGCAVQVSHAIIVVAEEEDQAFLNSNLQPETFQKLLKVAVKSCSKLKCLFPTTIARGLQQLAELYVEDNVQLEEVLGHTDVAGIMEDEEIVLPQLNYLRLVALPSLTNVCPGGCHFIFPSLRKLEFQDCGATVPTFSLTGDECVHADEKKLRVLRIGDCNNLCGGTSLFSCGFNNLEDLRIRNCRVKVVFQLGDLAVDGQSHQLSFPSLKYLRVALSTRIRRSSFARNMLQLKSLSVERCKDLEQIVVEDNDDHLQVLFPNLSQIYVKSCDKLKRILPISVARGLQLQDRDVRQNFKLKEVLGHEEKANLMDEKVIMLPQLDELTMVNAPQLKSIFYFENVTEWLGKDIQLPKLRKLSFSGLANLISFCPENCHSTWPALEEFRIYQCPNLTMPFLDQVRVLNLMKEKLRVLRIRDCNNLCGETSLFSCGFNNLEYLKIWNCGVKVVFQLGDLAVDGQSHQLSFPSLKKLELRGLKELEGLCNGSKHQIVVEDDDDHLQSLFPNLSKIHVKWCDKLKCVLPITMARGLQQLKLVTVAWANQLEEVFGHTDRVDVMTDREIQLPKLDELCLNDLPNLANFCPVGYHFIFPSLDSLHITGCPEMNTAFSLNQQNKFVHAEAKAPKISMKNEGVEFTLEPPIGIVCWNSDQFPKVLPLSDEQTVTQQNDIEN
ncbi:uncharacterized protein LOC116139735 [Pistacia vera]|uniref:uncharacterized protein LOC116139735 n=1 Tax=Pistacia vera TaxID=55513 RepID=UPI001262F3D6|nr:uncharacterized protein LOC116139735 [Pistacia vera]